MTRMVCRQRLAGGRIAGLYGNGGFHGFLPGVCGSAERRGVCESESRAVHVGSVALPSAVRGQWRGCRGVESVGCCVSVFSVGGMELREPRSAYCLRQWFRCIAVSSCGALSLHGVLDRCVSAE